MVLGRISSSALHLSVRRFHKKSKNATVHDPKQLNPEVEVFGKKPFTGKERIEERGNLTALEEMPTDLRDRRVVRIFQRPKNVMQQGTDNTKTWVLEHMTEQRWENPTMGWCSSGDPVSNLQIQFPTECAAICFAERQGYKWVVEPPPKIKAVKKNYSDIFSWNKRTRVTTK